MNTYSHGNISVYGSNYLFSLFRELEDDEKDTARPWINTEEVATVGGTLNEDGTIDTFELLTRIAGGEGSKFSEEENEYILSNSSLEADVKEEFEKNFYEEDETS